MEVKAKLNYLKISPRKVRLVIDAIRGLPVEKALSRLSFINKLSSRPIIKLLNSAVANAENNFQLKKENLFIKTITANEGPRLKRWRPRAFGRAAPIIKRSSHILVVLDELKPSARIKKKLSSAKGQDEIEVVKADQIKHEDILKDDKTAPIRPEKKPLFSFRGIKERFTRKTGDK